LYSVELELKRKRTEKAVQETSSRYRAIGDSITDLFFALDKTFRCTYWNAAAENLTGVSSHEALGKPLYQLFPDIQGSTAEQEYAAAVREQQPRSFIQTYEHNGRQAYFEVNIYPSSDDFSILAKDVTYRKQMEDALKKSWDYLENLNNSLGDAIFTIDMPEQRIQYVNRAVEHLFGYSIDDCIGRSIRMFFSDKRHYADFSKQLRKAFGQQQEILRLEQLVRKKDGDLFTAEITTTFLQEEGELSGVIIIVRDVTERKAMQLALEQERASLARKVDERTTELQSMNARLARASQMKDEFLAKMSHELRTPLNAILGYAKMLQKTDGLSPLQSEGLDTIQSSGEHLLNLINDILDLSKIEAGRMELHPTTFHFSEFLQQIANMIRVRTEHKQIDFMFEGDPNAPMGVYADEKRLREVLINLLDNAVKFTDQGFVKLKISVLRGGECIDDAGNVDAHSPYSIRFEVEDSGTGIAQEQLESIFLPFQQVGQNRYVQQGTGLGLSITQQLIKVMGGALHVESIEHEGSIFWFDLDLP
jgi:PAS domain S-box-containing protein